MLKVPSLNTDMKFTAKCITKKRIRKNAESAIATFLATEVLNICIFCKYKFLKITKLSEIISELQRYDILFLSPTKILKHD
jgi:hypothetical protein